MVINRSLYIIIMIIVAEVLVTAQTEPTIELSSNNTVSLDDASSMGGDLCLFLGYPSQPGQGIPIVFTIADMEDQPNDLQIEVTSSNVLVVAESTDNLIISKSGNQVTLQIIPMRAGSSTIRIIVEDSNWDADAFNLHLTVKDCKPIICVATDDIDRLSNNQSFTFEASDQIKSNATLSSGDIITFQAGQSIDLLPGFCNSLGSLFNAVIGECE